MNNNNKINKKENNNNKINKKENNNNKINKKENNKRKISSRTRFATEREIFLFDTLFHIFVLYAVLYSLFAILISTTTKREFNKTLVNAIQKLNPGFYNEITLCNVTQPAVTKSALTSLTNFYNTNPPTNRDEFNDVLIAGGGAVLVALFVSVVIAYLIMTYSANKNLNMKHILLVNLFLFVTLGCIEIIFFFNVGNNYAPVTPSEMEEMVYNSLQDIFIFS